MSDGYLGRRRVRAELLAHLIEGKVQLCLNYSPKDIMQDLKLELGICLTYMQSWRAREFVRMMVLASGSLQIVPLDVCDDPEGEPRVIRSV